MKSSHAMALRQTIDYCQGEHGKSQQGYFSAGGWAGEQLRSLLAELENENATDVTPVASSQPSQPGDNGMASVRPEDSTGDSDGQHVHNFPVTAEDGRRWIAACIGCGAEYPG